MSTNFRLELIKPFDAREELIFWIPVEREEWGGASEERRREYGSNLARLKTASELKKLLTLNLSSRRLYKLQAKICGQTLFRERVGSSLRYMGH